jgi:hypothetical protein
MTTPYKTVRYSIQINKIRRKLLSLSISRDDGSLFIALRNSPLPVMFINLILGNKIEEYPHSKLVNRDSNQKVTFHTSKNQICLPINDPTNKRVLSCSTKLKWWEFIAPNILSQIIIPSSVLENFPEENKLESDKCITFDLDYTGFDFRGPLVLYLCLIQEEKKLRDGIIISGNRWESDTMLYKLEGVDSYLFLKASQRINNSKDTIYWDCNSNPRNIFWVFDPHLVDFGNDS